MAAIKVIISTGYINGEEGSRIMSWTQERDDLVRKVMDGLEEHELRGEIEDTVGELVSEGVLTDQEEEDFLELMLKVDECYYDELTDIKIVKWEQLETFEPLG